MKAYASSSWICLAVWRWYRFFFLWGSEASWSSPAPPLLLPPSMVFPTLKLFLTISSPEKLLMNPARSKPTNPLEYIDRGSRPFSSHQQRKRKRNTIDGKTLFPYHYYYSLNSFLAFSYHYYYSLYSFLAFSTETTNTHFISCGEMTKIKNKNGLVVENIGIN